MHTPMITNRQAQSARITAAIAPPAKPTAPPLLFMTRLTAAGFGGVALALLATITNPHQPLRWWTITLDLAPIGLDIDILIADDPDLTATANDRARRITGQTNPRNGIAGFWQWDQHRGGTPIFSPRTYYKLYMKNDTTAAQTVTTLLQIQPL